MEKLCVVRMSVFLSIVLLKVVILSPILFNMYMDVMLNTLKSSEYGCHLGRTFVGCIAYAGDLILLSASVHDLQRMLTVCDNVARQLDILFNAKIFPV